jgi:hypothetical protein
VPGAYIRFLRVRGTQWADPVADALEIDGTLDGARVSQNVARM